MKRLLAIPFLMMLLTACGSAPGETNPAKAAPGDAASVGTVEAAICTSCLPGQYTSYYYCDPSAYSCGSCGHFGPFNIQICGTMPTAPGPQSYSPCGYCGAGFSTTILHHVNSCLVDGSISIQSSCFKPGPDSNNFKVCGSCPDGYTATSSEYAKECDPDCTDWSSPSCSGRPHNRVLCVK